MRNILFTLTLIINVVFCACNQHNPKDISGKNDVPVGLEIGNMAPEIVEKSVNGEDIKLSSLQGKMVLVDFWASWCPPCRQENPNLVETYHDFKNAKFKNGDGFTVFGVSLDKKKDAWLKGIADDKLEWPYHVSDLMGWNSAAAGLYNVQSIPSNYLIDGDGIIVDYGLRGELLDSVLISLMIK